ncbi:MAG: hypothetical protein M1814_001905 [Vezdaea aestivalis]|nr:MAG: hypothetical protein M1814_001905 [Vezdaea aestivalis]
MGPKIFIIGGTGYIGGDALEAIVNAHPEYNITCLVRNSDKGAQIGSRYPRIRFVYGDLDSDDLIADEAAKADVVLQCASSDHAGVVEALTAGLARHTASKPGCLIHTSGSAILSFADTESRTFGQAAEKIYNDWDGVGEITSIPDHAYHRHIDKAVLAAATTAKGKFRIAIVCPPTIYGEGRGTGNTRTDLSRLYLLLLEEALKEGGGNLKAWGSEGYFFAENGEHVWSDISSLVAKEVYKQGLIDSQEVESLTSDTIHALVPGGPVLWGSNSRGRAIRAKSILGWHPQEKSLEKTIPEDVRLEALRKQNQ